MENKLAEKIVVITGASSGAGRATAVALSLGKASLVLAARNEEALEELARECRDNGADVLIVPTDVTNDMAVTLLASRAAQWKGIVDVWVNNAGVLAAGMFEQTPWEVHERVISTNLLGYMRGAYAILPQFKKQGHGMIINNISIGAFLTVPYGAAYSASKYGLRGFFEALKGELAGYNNIHIVDLFPAFLNTPGIQHAGNYTAKVLRPAPPVYDPAIVANAVKHSILHPQPAFYPGLFPTIFKIAHAMFPLLMTKTTTLLIRRYLKDAKASDQTNGNLFETVPYGMASKGNAVPRIKPGTKQLLIFGVLAFAVGSAAMLIATRTTNRRKIPVQLAGNSIDVRKSKKFLHKGLLMAGVAVLALVLPRRQHETDKAALPTASKI